MKQHFMFGAALMCAFGIGSIASLALAHSQYPPLSPVLTTQTTAIGQPIAYPKGKAKISSAIVTLQPGQETGLHSHNVPLFGYILEGQVELDYGAYGTRSLKTGDAIVEAIGEPHSGTATGHSPTRILVVFLGAEGIENTVVH